jgi:hypothetical protein
MIDKSQYKLISQRAVQVLGSQTIHRMSDPQVGLLNKELKYLVDRHQSADKVTDAEIEGAYEMIVMYALPTGSHEHLLDPSQLGKV